MHVAGGDHQLVELSRPALQSCRLISCSSSIGVDGALLIPQHEAVVADRLNLQIVVETSQDVTISSSGLPSKIALVEFARLTGRSEQQSLSVLYEFALWHRAVSCAK